MTKAPSHVASDVDHLRAWTFGAIVICAVAFAALVLDEVPVGPPPLALDTDSSLIHDCGLQVFLRADETPLAELVSLRMNSNTFLRARLCGPTRLQLTAEGSAVAGVGARLGIHLGDQLLFDAPIVEPTFIDVRTDYGGWLLITFGNDLYRPPLDRNLWLSDVGFTQLVGTDINDYSGSDPIAAEP